MSGNLQKHSIRAIPLGQCDGVMSKCLVLIKIKQRRHTVKQVLSAGDQILMVLSVEQEAICEPLGEQEMPNIHPE